MPQPKNLLSTFPRVFTSVFLLLAIWSSWSGGLDPDVLFSIDGYIPVISAVLAILVFSEAAGSILLNRFLGQLTEHSLDLRVLTGVLFFSSLAALLGLFGLIGSASVWLFYVVAIFIAFVADRSCPPPMSKQNHSLLKELNLSKVVLSALLMAFGIFAFFPNVANPDPLYYHMRAPLLWYLNGKIYFDQGNPLLFLTGLWESFYLFAMHILPAKRGMGLIEYQLLFQLLHFCAGGMVAISLLQKFSERIFGLHRDYYLWCMILLLCCLPFNETISLAKNDWGVLALSLACFLLLHSYLNNQKRAYLFLAGAFAGATLVSKPSHFLITFLFSLALIVAHRKKLKHSLLIPVSLLVLGGLVGLAPIVARNLIYVGTPLFPFGNYQLLSPSDQLYFALFISSPGKLTLNEYWNFALDLLFLLPPVPLLFLHLNPNRRKEFILFLPLLATFLYFWQFYHPTLNWRLVGAFFPIAIFLIAVSLRQYLEPLHRSLPFIALGLLSILTFFSSSPSLGSSYSTYLGRISRLDNPSLMIRKHFAGDAMAWLRMKEEEPKSIYFSGNNALYYLYDMDVKEAESDYVVGNILHPLESGEERIRALADMGAKFFVETYATTRMPATAILLRPIISRCPGCVVFAGKGSRIASIPDLLSFISQENYEPEPKIKLRHTIGKQK